MPSKTTRRRPTVWRIIVFALSLVIFGLSVIAVVFWTPIDDTFVNRADAAGDMNRLLPHQTGLWLVLHALTFAAFLLSVFAFVTMWKSRPECAIVQRGRQPADQLRPPTQQHEPAT